ncbi:hypothetical protein IFR05_013486 [Cadophora sp. M221]|nr:hypothetical protein IFR05_013486 [Cadophora sp. M221]
MVPETGVGTSSPLPDKDSRHPFGEAQQDRNDGTEASAQLAPDSDFVNTLETAVRTVASGLSDTPEDVGYRKFLGGLEQPLHSLLSDEDSRRSLPTFPAQNPVHWRAKYAEYLRQLQGMMFGERDAWIEDWQHRRVAEFIESSARPSQSSTETVSFGKLASLMNFKRVDSANLDSVIREPFRVQPPVHALLNGSMANVLGPGSVHWIHLPANNMSWVETLMKTLYSDSSEIGDGPNSYDKTIMNSQYWAGRQNNSSNDRVGHNNDMVFFMPYLHWETDIARLQTHHIAQHTDRQAMLSSSFTDEELSEMPCNVDEKLLRKYLNSPSPLHVRRTLDQAYYYTLRNTRKRDRDQVVMRYVKNRTQNDSSPPVLMVDQCWLWVLGDLVITCFPGCWIEDGVSNPDDPIDLLERIVQEVSQRETYETISSPLDLATMIIDCCASNVVESNIEQGMRSDRLHFLEWFSRSIRRVMAHQTSLFEKFCDDSRRLQTTLEKVISAIRHRERGVSLPDSYEDWEEELSELQQPTTGGLSDITQEIANLREIKDISDELHMIEDVISQQQRALNMFDGAVIGVEKWLPEKLLQNTQKRKRTIEQLHRDASHTYSWIVDLLDLKQKQTNVSEARSSRFQAELANKQAEQATNQAIETAKQGKSIMLFTTVTILFLPLSTVSSLFSLNAKELNGGNLRIGVVFAYLFPISFLFVFFALLLAFHTGLRQLCTLYAQIGLAYLDHATGFSKIVRQDNDERIEELKLRLDVIKEKTRGVSNDSSVTTDIEMVLRRRRFQTLGAPWWAIKRTFRRIFRRRPRSISSSDRVSSLVDD